MGRRGKDDDDAALWDKIARTASPLKRRESRAASGQERRAPAPKPPTPEPPLARLRPRRRLLRLRNTVHVPRADGLDRQTARQLDEGQARGRGAARSPRAAAARCPRAAPPLPQAGAGAWPAPCAGHHRQGRALPRRATSFYEEEERGVLRNAVPRWLAEPDLAPLVVSFSPAPRPLGGDGALYVRLRRALRK